MRTFQTLGLATEIGRGAVIQRDDDRVNAAGETLLSIGYADRAPGGWAALYMMFQTHMETVLDQHDKALPLERMTGVKWIFFAADTAVMIFLRCSGWTACSSKLTGDA